MDRSRLRQRGTLTLRVVLVTCLVALISVLITAAVALPVAVRSANAEAQVILAEKARVVADAIDGRDTPAALLREEQRARRVARTLREQGVMTILIWEGKADTPGLPPRIVAEISGGEAVSQRLLYRGRMMLVEGRSVGQGGGIVLLQPIDRRSTVAVLSRLWLPLGAGLLAGLLAGILLSRRLGRPLRDVAAAARRLSSGDRAVRAPTEVPAEIADVSVALNDLATALTASENRQRTFLTSVSHELRTPLTIIKGYAEALADGVVGPDGAAQAGATMLTESAHLDRLIEDLLVLARLEADDFPLELMAVDLVALISTAAHAWGGRFAGKGVVLRTELPDHRVFVRTDAGRVRQVVDGLLENAVRLVPAGSPVVLSVRAADVTVVASAADAELTRAGAHAVVEIRDGGPGFTDDDLDVAFDQGALYQRYKGVRTVGSGLGLALAARLVRRLGGHIEAGHAIEGGARFTVLLPVS